MGSATPKQFLLLEKRPLLAYTIDRFLQSPYVHEIILVVNRAQINSPSLDDCLPEDDSKPIKIIAGGERRQDSVANGLKHLHPATEIVTVHDGVRPFVTVDLINATIAACKENDGAIVAIPATDTLKSVKNMTIQKTIARDAIWQAQTPQTFRRTVLEIAYERARQTGFLGTDDASLVERLNYQILVVPGSPDNLKITCQSDLELAKAHLRRLGQYS